LTEYSSEVILECVRIEMSRDMEIWLGNAERDREVLYLRALALLDYLIELEARPVQETKTLMKVRQARRHEIWRLAHPYDPEVAVRILCWFPDESTAVVALIAGDKKKIGDDWYDSATPRAEAAVDQWLRELRSQG
jgi:hypothetical protein